LPGLATTRQRAGSRTQQHSLEDVVSGKSGSPGLSGFGETTSTESRGALRLQSAGGGVAPRIPIVKTAAL